MTFVITEIHRKKHVVRFQAARQLLLSHEKLVREGRMFLCRAVKCLTICCIANPERQPAVILLFLKFIRAWF